MTFMNSYKRLDNLCRDLLRVPQGKSGVTAYIESMEKISNGIFRVENWESDYKKLKHYRYIRNQIAHDNYADEASMTSYCDTDWIDNFYSRIMNQTDPLALYRKATKPKPQQPNQEYQIPTYSNTTRRNRQPVGCATIVLFIATIAVFIAFLF